MEREANSGRVLNIWGNEVNMIKDKLKNAKIYYSLSEGLKKGFEWLNTNDLHSLKDGRYEIDGDKIYANVQTYEPKIDAKYEAHRDYIDIQYVVEGSELVGVVDLDNCKTCEAYDVKRDIEFLDNQGEDDYQKLNQGDFLVLFPTDAHKPSIFDGVSKKVKKVVVKVRV